MEPLVSIIILNWNGMEYLKKCLDAVFSQTYKKISVIVVDNSSTDGSVEFINKNYRNVKVISLGRNCGFAEGNNIGIRMALNNRDVRYVAVLNNDTEADRNWISEMVSAAEKDERTGSCACKTIFMNDRTKIETAGIVIYENCSGAGRGAYKDANEYSHEEEVFGAYGAAALYKREMLEDTKIGNDYFDSDYFTYQEEFDLSWRALLRGWKCTYVPTAKVYHVGSATGRKMPGRVKYLLERNRIWTITKNLQNGLLPYCLPHMLIYEMASIPFYIARKQFFLVMKARLEALVKIKRILRKRKTIQERAKITAGKMKSHMIKRDYRGNYL